MDWDDLRVFLQVARAGQMASAARLLGIDHSTISRRIARLERQVGATLFDRAARRLSITANGTRLLAAAEAMEALLLRDVAAIGEAGRDVTGCVRIGTSEGFGAFYLARRLAALTAGCPGLEIELAALPQVFSLAAREVDVAITMDRPESGSLRFKKLATYDLGLYASRDYIEAHGRPASLADLPAHRWCGYIEELLFTEELDLLTFDGFVVSPRYRTTSVTAQLEAIDSGETIGMLPVYVAARCERLERLLPDLVAPTRDYWLSVHEDVANVPRVRHVIGAIEEATRADRRLFRPG